MFRTLSYDVEFDVTGRKLNETIDFARGLTAVFGANESGKSFLMEMLRFSLFGSAALRGPAETYVRLSADCTFDIRGQTYMVERTLKKAMLLCGEEVLATGITAVNERIVALLGFGLGVFDIACASNQEGTLALTGMRPTERKRLVDTTVGIGLLEVVAKWARDEALALEKEAKLLQEALRKPVEPVRPPGHRPMAEVRERHQAALDARVLAAQLKGWLENVMIEPKKPECSIPMPAESLQPLVAQQKNARAELEKVTAKLRVIPEKAPYTQEQLDGFKAQWEDHSQYLKVARVLRDNPKPDLTRAETARLVGEWTLYARSVEREAEIIRLDNVRKKLLQHETVCPSCDHHWLDEHQDKTLAETNRMLAELQSEPKGVKPEFEKNLVLAAAQFYSKWADEDYAKLVAVPRVEEPQLSTSGIAQAEMFIKLVAERPELEDLKELHTNELKGADYEAMYFTRLAFEESLQNYQRQINAYETWVGQRIEKKREFDKAALAGEKFEEARELLSACEAYEASMVRFAVDHQAYVDGMLKISRRQDEADQFRRVQEAMVKMRVRIKQYLLPSLNSVASRLLSRMTAGSRNTIEVDDDFEIRVDGQRVETLSGSGKVCTNLALRIALGQVLVNNTFSVFLADEIDGSMDPVRAEETASTLRNLAKSISQVLVISHKPVEADQSIVLGASYEPIPHPNGLQQVSG